MVFLLEEIHDKFMKKVSDPRQSAGFIQHVIKFILFPQIYLIKNHEPDIIILFKICETMCKKNAGKLRGILSFPAMFPKVSFSLQKNCNLTIDLEVSRFSPQFPVEPLNHCMISCLINFYSFD